MGTYTILRLFFKDNWVDSGRNIVFPSVVKCRSSRNVRQRLRFAFGEFVVLEDCWVVAMFQVIVCLLSTNIIMQIEVRLTHMNLFLNN